MNPEQPLFILTVDAEEEWPWEGKLPQAPFSTQNIQRLPAFQDFCAEIELKPTYFVDAAVLADEKNRQILTAYYERGECDVGAQLHPWCTDPIDETLNDFNSHTINLNKQLAQSKITTLTTLLTETFGRHPLSFRCGRWGMNGRLMRILAEQGYKVDSSVRPRYQTEYFHYKDAAKGAPYWPDMDDICAPGKQRDILEVPVSDGFTRANFNAKERLFQALGQPPINALRARGVLWHLGILRKISMSPEGMLARDLCQCIDAHIQRGNTVITMFMHSSDLLPEATPYVRNEQELTRFLEVMKTAALHAKTVHGARFVTMREAHEILTGQNPA